MDSRGDCDSDSVTSLYCTPWTREIILTLLRRFGTMERLTSFTFLYDNEGAVSFSCRLLVPIYQGISGGSRIPQAGRGANPRGGGNRKLITKAVRITMFRDPFARNF